MNKHFQLSVLLVGFAVSTANGQTSKKPVMNFGVVDSRQVEFGKAFAKENSRSLSPSVAGERVAFTVFIKQLRPAFIIKYGITTEQLKLLASAVDKRLSQLGPAFVELENKWLSVSPDEQKLVLAEFLASDERIATLFEIGRAHV